jgi:hypothetical protein
MAFYTGKEVKVWVCTESVDSSTDIALGVKTDAGSGKNEMNIFGSVSATASRPTEMFAAPYNHGADNADLNVRNLTGVDISIGAVDEDISYFQTANVGKIEIKKETSVTLTKKMTDKAFLVAYQGKVFVDDAEDGVGNHPSRWGLKNSTDISSGSSDPKHTLDAGDGISYGYRVHILLKASGQVISIPNCTLMSHAVTVSNDAANEETIEFMSTVKPKITASYSASVNEAQTLAADI